MDAGFSQQPVEIPNALAAQFFKIISHSTIPKIEKTMHALDRAILPLYLQRYATCSDARPDRRTWTPRTEATHFPGSPRPVIITIHPE